MKKSTKVNVKNVNHPGQIRSVDAAMYEAMRRAVLEVVPKRSPGITIAEMEKRVTTHLPSKLFPNGAKAGWWAKTVQLDLEAKGVLIREKTKPVRLRKG